MASAAASEAPPTDSSTRSNSPRSGMPTDTVVAPSSCRPAPRSGRPTTAVISAPRWPASCRAKRPTPPAAPVTSTRPSAQRSPIWMARWAVSPATGRVAAASKETSSGRGARKSTGTTARSAHAPPPTIPTTRVPTAGPEPSVAASTTSPARSQPGTVPSAAPARPFTSPRLSDTARTATTTRRRPGVGSGTSSRASPVSAPGRATSALTGPRDAVFARSARPRARSLAVVLDGLHVAHRRLVRVLAGVAPGPALAQEVPALVELRLHPVQAPGVVLAQPLALVGAGLELVLLLHELVDVPQHGLVGFTHRASRYGCTACPAAVGHTRPGGGTRRLVPHARGGGGDRRVRRHEQQGLAHEHLPQGRGRDGLALAGPHPHHPAGGPPVHAAVAAQVRPDRPPLLPAEPGGGAAGGERAGLRAAYARRIGRPGRTSFWRPSGVLTAWPPTRTHWMPTDSR